jgi:site-specific DNA recombinase
MPRPAVIYTRVSSREQEEGFSLSAQRGLLEAYARERGFKVVTRFEESETAKTAGKRPVFGKMVSFFREHKDTVLLVEKTDRLYRNLTDWITLDDLKIEIHFVKEGSAISPESHSSQKFLHGIKVLMAKNYVENLSEEIRKGMTKKAQEGAFPSAAPIGYRNTEDKSVGIVPDPDTAPLIRQLFAKAASGNHSASELTREARSLGLRSKRGRVLAKNTICANILRNPAYYGSFRWGKKLYDGRYEPLILKATFDRVQQVLEGRRNSSKGRVHEFTFTGLIRCSRCGDLLSGDLKKGRYVYYRCAGKEGCKRFYPEKLFESETLSLLGSLQIDQSVSEWILQELEAMEENQPIDEKRLKRLVARRKELQGLRTRAYEEKLLEKIDEAFWTERSAAWQRETAEIEEELGAAERAPSKEEILAAARRPIELLEAASNLYVSQEPHEKARLLKTMVSNFTVDNGTISVSMRSPFDVLARGAKTQDWWS